VKNNIRELRKQKALSQQQLADSLDVSRQTINSLENGRYDPSLRLAFGIASYFNLSIEDIFDSSDVL
jgi:putative transcriptional regulator